MRKCQNCRYFFLEVKLPYCVAPETMELQGLSYNYNKTKEGGKMLKKDAIDYEMLIKWGEWGIKQESKKLEVLYKIIENLETDPKLLEIYDYKGDTDTGIYNEYCQMCSKVWDTYSGFYDNGCSSGMQGFYKFVSDIIVYLFDSAKEFRLKQKKQKIEQLKSEIEELEKDTDATV